MGFATRVKSYRNAVDFFLRKSLPWGRALPSEFPLPDKHRRLAAELLAFFELFPWEEWLSGPQDLVVADIGTRNFCSARALEQLFASHGKKPVLHGIELDAHRRLLDFRTRADWGRFHARQVSAGQYHAMDFLTWEAPLDVAFLLNPFVTHSPLLAWGLPLSVFSPQKIFARAYQCLKSRRGILILCSPDEEEKQIACELARNAGFTRLAEKDWYPSDSTVQKDARLGSAWRA